MVGVFSLGSPFIILDFKALSADSVFALSSSFLASSKYSHIVIVFQL
ncbi:MAG: hypothetical protein WCG25_08820 [bacterium]